MSRQTCIVFLMPFVFCVLFFVPIRAQNTEKGAASASVTGRQLFSSTCAACHGLDGRGGEHAPNIATEARVQQLSDSAIAHIVRNGISAAGMPAFKDSFTAEQIQAVVIHLRTLQGTEIATSSAGDPARGRLLFFGQAHCSDCHMVNGHGGFLGIDLSGYSHTHSAADIREAITNPNKNLDSRNGAVLILTRSGQKYTGLVRNEDNFSLQMQTSDGAFHIFDKTDLARIEHQPRSLMPSDYGKKLTPAQLDDLASFLHAMPAGAQSVQGEKEAEQ